MAHWNAKMPRTEPAGGKAYVVVAIKGRDGYRVEISGEYDAARAEAALAALLPSLAAAQPQGGKDRD